MTDDGYDVFVSYASEDRLVALPIAEGLQSNGFAVWMDRFVLKPGDRILEVIDEGLRLSRAGVLLISAAFIDKGWPAYELDVLMRDQIEGRKRLLPVWHEVNAVEVRTAYPGLAGIFAPQTADGMEAVVRRLVEGLAVGARAVAVMPTWEKPVERFLAGRGEALAGPDGPAFTIWEAVLHGGESLYPLWLGGTLYTRADLLSQIHLRWYGDPLAATHHYVPREWLVQIGELLRQHDIEPGIEWPT